MISITHASKLRGKTPRRTIIIFANRTDTSVFVNDITTTIPLLLDSPRACQRCVCRQMFTDRLEIVRRSENAQREVNSQSLILSACRWLFLGTN